MKSGIAENINVRNLRDKCRSERSHHSAAKVPAKLNANGLNFDAQFFVSRSNFFFPR